MFQQLINIFGAGFIIMSSMLLFIILMTGLLRKVAVVFKLSEEFVFFLAHRQEIRRLVTLRKAMQKAASSDH